MRPARPKIVARLIREALGATTENIDHKQRSLILLSQVKNDPRAVGRPMWETGNNGFDIRQLSRMRTITVSDPNFVPSGPIGCKRDLSLALIGNDAAQEC
jgi:hypothetical protein